MSDNEIINALEICNSLHLRCGNGCPYYEVPYKNGKRCSEMMIEDALDLINRQKAEVERLKEELDGETVKNMRLGHEIEGLKNSLDAQASLIEKKNLAYGRICVKHRNEINTAKSEAIKEFAKKLKDYHKNYEGFCVVDDDDIDNLVEEMAGE